MRILGGRNRGRILRVPPGVRPSGGRLREALFSMLGSEIVDASVLDLFAGSGAIGLEAMSRGARSAVFVERKGPVLPVLRGNIELLGEGRCELIPGTIPECLSRRFAPASYDLVFADPPYAWHAWHSLVEHAIPLLRRSGILVLEHSVRSDLDVEIGELGALGAETRAYGESCLTVLGKPTP